MAKWKVCFVMLILCGCYNQRKAQNQVAKADINYPGIIARLCAEKFPVAEIFIPGDSVIVLDTVQGEGIIITETITVKDTVMITVTLPPKVITKTIRLVDTVKLENTAAIKACEISRDQALQLATEKTTEAVKWKKKSKNRLWTIIGIGGGIALYIAGAFIRRKVKK